MRHSTLSLETRNSWCDLARALAIFGVVLIHTCGPAFYGYKILPTSDWLIVNFFDSLARCAVPLFVMISGAILLTREDEISFQIIRHRIYKVVIPLVVWSIIFLLWVSYHNHSLSNWKSILWKPTMYHLWFVYMMIGLYLLFPILQILFNAFKKNSHLKKYFFLLWFVITCLPIYFRIPFLHLLIQPSLLMYGGYFLAGALLVRYERFSTFTYIALFILSILVTFGLTWYFSWQANNAVEKAYLYFSPNVFVASISAFVIISRTSLNDKQAKVISWLSEKSFFIFFSHILVLECVRYDPNIIALGHSLSIWCNILLIAFITFIVSISLAFLAHLIPRGRIVFG